MIAGFNQHVEHAPGGAEGQILLDLRLDLAGQRGSGDSIAGRRCDDRDRSGWGRGSGRLSFGTASQQE
ncbi:hypothetical protein N8D56_09590 [Devosia sp. A8/3-2]|nr:hypothetical protein N8D56_09590 [Devosia sp. A8/3-2]